MFSRSSRATKTKTPTAPTKFKGKDHNNSTFWRKHALEAPVAVSSIPPLPSSWTGSSTSMPSTSAGRRGASGSARSVTNPYKTFSATGRRKMHKIRQRISRVAEDERLLTSIHMCGLSSSGRFARLAAEKLVRKADQITESLRPHALFRGPKLNWLDIQNINRKLDKEEAEKEGRTIDEGNVNAIPDMDEEQVQESFQRSLLVPQVIMPSVQKGKGKNKAESKEGDTDTDTCDTDTDIDGDTDVEDENKENVSLQVSPKAPRVQKSSPTKATELATPLRASNSPNLQTIVADEERTTVTPDLNRTQIPSAPTSPSPILEYVPVTPQKPNDRLGQLPAMESMIEHSPADAGLVQETAPTFQSQPTVGRPLASVPDSSSRPVIQPEIPTVFNIAQFEFQQSQSGGSQNSSFSGDSRFDVHQPVFTHPSTYHQTLLQSSSSIADVQFTGHVQQPQTLFPAADTQSTSQILQPQFPPHAQFIPTQDAPFSFPTVVHNPISQPVGNDIFGNSSNYTFQFEYPAFVPQSSNVVPSVSGHSFFFNSIMPQQPHIASSTQPIIRWLPVLAEDPPLDRSVLFGPPGLPAFAKEKFIPFHELVLPGTPNSASRFDDGTWLFSRKRRLDEQDAQEQMKPGPLDIRNLPSLPKKKYSGRPPKGSEEDLIRRLELERKNEEKRKKKKANRRVRFLLPDEEGSPARKKRRTDEDEHLDSIRGNSPQPNSQGITELNAPLLESETDADPVMPGAYIAQPEVASMGQRSVIGHIFSFVREQLGNCQFQDDERVEEYPV